MLAKQCYEHKMGLLLYKLLHSFACSMTWLENYKTEFGNQSQISSIWLAEMATGRYDS
jgi:hypothetical protein